MITMLVPETCSENFWSKQNPAVRYLWFSIAEIWGRYLAGITPLLLSGRSTNYLLEQASKSRGSRSQCKSRLTKKKKEKKRHQMVRKLKSRENEKWSNLMIRDHWIDFFRKSEVIKWLWKGTIKKNLKTGSVVRVCCYLTKPEVDGRIFMYLSLGLGTPLGWELEKEEFTLPCSFHPS